MNAPTSVQPLGHVTYPLSHPQKRIWYMEQIFPGTSFANIGGPVRIKGAIAFSLLERAILAFIQRHDGLRLQFVPQDEDIRQFVAAHEDAPLDFYDFSKEPDPEASFWSWIDEEAGKPFALTHSKLYYFAMFRISDEDNGYLIKSHHMIADGWSNQLATSQIAELYSKLMDGERIEDAGPAPSYIDYIQDAERYLASPRFTKSRRFWNDKYTSIPEGVTPSAVVSTEGRRYTVELDMERSQRIQSFADAAGISLNTFFVLAYFIYMYKSTQHQDLVVGTPVLNRSGKKEKSMFGMFTSTMPFRYVIRAEDTIVNALHAVQKALMECYFHQRYPYDLLAQDLELKKKGYDQLFHTSINYYNTTMAQDVCGMPVDNTEFYNGHQLYELQLVIKHWSRDGGLTLDYDYRLDAYRAEQIEEMSKRLLLIIEQMVDQPERLIRGITLLTEEEQYRELHEHNRTTSAYPKERTVLELFEEQAAKRPEAIAVVHGHEEWSYQQLNEHANRLARVLLQHGAGKASIVGLWMQHSIEAVAAILAVMKTGAAYLPIDPSYPEERIRYMLEDSRAQLVLTNLSDTILMGYAGQVLTYSNLMLDHVYSSNLEHVHAPGDLAYVIYTSGSTGKPKGAMIEQQGLTNYIWWAQKVYVRDHIPTFPLYSSLAFDLTVTSIFTPLICGGRICVYRDDGDEFVLYRIMRDEASTIVKLTPAHLSLLKEGNYKQSSVKRFIVGGEDLKTSLAKDITDAFGGHIEIYNEYGPTETVVGCMIHQYDPSQDQRVSVPIGVPADNVTLYILDPDQNPVAAGMIGELYIGGDGVARGYLHREQLTQERFLDNPFVTGKKMYRTGDLVKRLPDGKLEYIGRVDHQVKIRGYRIETGEIEKAITEHERISDAFVMDRENDRLGKYLCAYIVKQGIVENTALKQYLAVTLPSYMVPHVFVELEEIPLTINGKVNRGMLPEPEHALVQENEHATARNSIEAILIEIVRGVLQVEQLGLYDHFYDLGGDSIKAIQVSSRMNKAGYLLKVRDILENPIIEQMALRIEPLMGESLYSQARSEGIVKPLPIMSWFFKQKFEDPAYYHQSVLLEMKAAVDMHAVKAVLLQLAEHHDGLRLQVDLELQELKYHHEPDRLELFQTISLAHIEDDEQQTARLIELGETFKRQFDLRDTLLIGGCLFDLGKNGQRLLITAHHLVIDGVSWRILLEDFADALDRRARGQSCQLPSKTASLKLWSDSVSQLSVSHEEEQYWNAVLEGIRPIPLDMEHGEALIAHSHVLERRWTEQETRTLMHECHQAYGTKPVELMMAALALAAEETFQMDDFVIELESHGREQGHEEIDLSRTIGWFTSMYPVRLTSPVKGAEPHALAARIKSVKEQLRAIPSQGIGFGVLQAKQKLALDYDACQLVRFNFLGDFDAAWDNPWFTLAEEGSGLDSSRANARTALLDIQAMIVHQSLRVSVNYSQSQFADVTLHSFMARYEEALTAIISHCAGNEVQEFTPSDFDTVNLSQDELDSLFT